MENSNLDYSDPKAVLQYPLVIVIFILSCIPFVLLKQSGLSAISIWFMPESSAELLTTSSIWRLWSPTFVHYTFPHILPNLILWCLFASKIEKQSRVELFVLFIIIAACSNFAQWWFEGPKFGGLSGVVYGLMGYLWVLQHFTGKECYRFDPIIALLMLLAIPLSFAGYLGKLANYAHIAGLLCGISIACISIFLQSDKNKSK